MILQTHLLVSATLTFLVVCPMVSATVIDKSDAEPTQSAVEQQTNQVTISPRAGEQINWQVLSIMLDLDMRM